MSKRLVAAIACRNQGSRLYGKPVQNLDVETGIRILDNIIDCINSLSCVDEIILGISEGVDNLVFLDIAKEKNLRYIIGNQTDVLGRLIACGNLGNATDIFRVTSESPFLYFEPVEELWQEHITGKYDATFMDDIIDGCGFEIIRLDALKTSHELGQQKHRSELCTLYIRENKADFNIRIAHPPAELLRKDLRLTVDNPEDLALCRIVYTNFKQTSPRISVQDIVKFIDNNPDLIKLIAPFTEAGYKTMYR